jgi:protein ImuB
VTSAGSRRYLAVVLPWMAEDSWRAAAEPPTLQPIAFTERLGNAIRLTALSRAAVAHGLEPGLTLADARARIPDLLAIERDHRAEAQLLARVVAGLVRYTPAAAADPPDGAILDIAGCLQPFGRETALAADLLARLSAGGVAARHGLGDTPQAARARARFGTPDQPLATLPVAALEAAPEVTLALRRAGLRQVGDLAARPRAMLAARFGDLGLRLARLLEEEDPRFTPDRPLPPVAASRRFGEPIGRLEDALLCVAELTGEAAMALSERHQGGRRFAARLFRCDGQVAQVAIETGRPTRDPALVVRLLRERVDALRDPIDPGFGFDAIRLDVDRLEPLAPAQDGLERPAVPAEALGRLFDRLAARLGPARLHRLGPHDSHVPECGQVTLPPTGTPAWGPPEPDEPPLRPLRLLDPPVRVDAVLSGVPDGPPRRFRWNNETHVVRFHEGPERIAAEWWRRQDRGGRPRDYYRVEDEAGRRFWLFRHGEGTSKDPPPWFLHGLFA